jgi:hypothetical protein
MPWQIVWLGSSSRPLRKRAQPWSLYINCQKSRLLAVIWRWYSWRNSDFIFAKILVFYLFVWFHSIENWSVCIGRFLWSNVRCTKSLRNWLHPFLPISRHILKMNNVWIWRVLVINQLQEYQDARNTSGEGIVIRN